MKHMNQLNNLSKLNPASFFNKETLQKVIRVSDNTLYSNIKRWLKTGDLIQLKRGVYVNKIYISNLDNKDSYIEFIANNLKKPSYLSGEYVLQKYGMLTESVFAVTSASLKKTQSYNNDFGTFIYSNIKESLFTGYKIIDKDGFEIKEASKAKALFDYFYSRLWRVAEINKNYLKTFRLNLGEMKKQDFEEFQNYVSLSDISKFSNLTNLLKEITYDN